MRLRTYYWSDRIRGRTRTLIRRHILRRKNSWNEFAFGNAGDIFAQNLIKHVFPDSIPINVNKGPRLLCIGSIAHKMDSGDILCGVGSKGPKFPDIDAAEVLIHSLRGPITEQRLSRAGFDTSSVQWLGDPGLLISEILPIKQAKTGRVIFVPHYRERRAVRDKCPEGIDVVDIDADPLLVGQQIQTAELVYSSSLHGIVFAHALGRPVVMVKPATDEPISKFEDYFLGVGLDAPRFLQGIEEAKFSVAPISPAVLKVTAKDFVFPSRRQLREKGILA